jgi:hypothetical protein
VKFKALSPPAVREPLSRFCACLPFLPQTGRRLQAGGFFASP